MRDKSKKSVVLKSSDYNELFDVVSRVVAQHGMNDRFVGLVLDYCTFADHGRLRYIFMQLGQEGILQKAASASDAAELECVIDEACCERPDTDRVDVAAAVLSVGVASGIVTADRMDYYLPACGQSAPSVCEPDNGHRPTSIDLNKQVLPPSSLPTPLSLRRVLLLIAAGVLVICICAAIIGCSLTSGSGQSWGMVSVGCLMITYLFVLVGFASVPTHNGNAVIWNAIPAYVLAGLSALIPVETGGMTVAAKIMGGVWAFCLITGLLMLLFGGKRRYGWSFWIIAPLMLAAVWCGLKAGLWLGMVP